MVGARPHQQWHGLSWHRPFEAPGRQECLCCQDFTVGCAELAVKRETAQWLDGAEFALGALYFFAEDDGFGDGAHGHPALAALLLEHEVSLLFA
jgi:hypothetical protein